MIEYTGTGASGVTINGEPVNVVSGPRSLVEELLASGKWARVGDKPKKPARKKRGK